MTIDEAIAHEREEADIARGNIINSNNLDGYESWNNSQCIKCAEEHEQLAEWLEELKSYRAHIFSGDMTQAMLKEQYCKAVDDCIKEVEEEEKQHNHIITKDCLFWLKRKFEQLKGDASNGTDNQ